MFFYRKFSILYKRVLLAYTKFVLPPTDKHPRFYPNFCFRNQFRDQFGDHFRNQFRDQFRNQFCDQILTNFVTVLGPDFVNN